MFNFKYQKDIQGNYYPLVTLTAFNQERILKTSALLDSGANISLFQPELAKSLALNIEKGEEIYLGGIGGRIKGYKHLIKVEIAHKALTVPVVFSNEFIASFNLLGRKGVFENFKILFEEKKLSVKFF